MNVGNTRLVQGTISSDNIVSKSVGDADHIKELCLKGVPQEGPVNGLVSGSLEREDFVVGFDGGEQRPPIKASSPRSGEKREKDLIDHTFDTLIPLTFLILFGVLSLVSFEYLSDAEGGKALIALKQNSVNLVLAAYILLTGCWYRIHRVFISPAWFLLGLCACLSFVVGGFWVFDTLVNSLPG